MRARPALPLYLDNAATSWPKPRRVTLAAARYDREIGASAGRGAYPRARAAGRRLEETRRALAELFNAPDPRRVAFTLNATDALNLAIHGLKWRPGDRALVSPFEHNSVRRPLNALGAIVDVMPADADGRVRVERLSAALRPRTRLIACLHASNVTGVIQPVGAVGAFARRRGVPFLVDAAQSAGAVPIDVRAQKIDLLAFPGHKALLGPLGTGGLIVAPGLDLEPPRQGGTGSVSEEEVQPRFYPDRLESGSHNGPGLWGLREGVRYVAARGVDAIRRAERERIDQFREGVRGLAGVRMYAPRKADDQVAVFSLRSEGSDPRDDAARLWSRDRLMVRAGLHCAPGAHRFIGTFPSGTYRFSFGPWTTARDVDRALRGLRRCAGAARSTFHVPGR